MASLRNAVDLLAKIMRSHGASEIKAEIFRLAKFNDSNAVSSFWRLLFELLCYCEFGQIDKFVHEKYDQLSSEEIVVYVKREFHKRGYFASDFAALPNDLSRGSRELLLAFGWLLSNEQIFEKFAMDRNSVLDDDTRGMYEEEMLNNSVKNSVNFETLPGDLSSRVKQLLWLNNKLRLNLCSLHSMLSQRIRLKHKIHEATAGRKPARDRSHLSMLEVYLARNPKYLQKNINILEKDSERLHNLLVWKEHEGIFWKWMESVLKEKLLQPRTGDFKLDISASKSADLIASATAERLRESHRTLRETITKYEAIIEHLERVLSERSTELSSEVLDQISSEISSELSIQKTNLAIRGQKGISNLARQNREPVEPQFILEKKEVGRAPKQGLYSSHSQSQSSFTSVLSVLSADQDGDTATDIDDEIDRLKEWKRRLEKDLSDKQNHLKMEIEKLSEKLVDAVCIPPLNRNLNMERNV